MSEVEGCSLVDLVECAVPLKVNPLIIRVWCGMAPVVVLSEFVLVLFHVLGFRGPVRCDVLSEESFTKILVR